MIHLFEPCKGSGPANMQLGVSKNLIWNLLRPLLQLLTKSPAPSRYCRHSAQSIDMGSSTNTGPQNRPQSTMILMIGLLKKRDPPDRLSCRRLDPYPRASGEEPWDSQRPRAPEQVLFGGFQENKGLFLGALIIRIIVDWSLFWGPVFVELPMSLLWAQSVCVCVIYLAVSMNLGCFLWVSSEWAPYYLGST